MKQALTIGLAAAALVTASALVLADGVPYYYARGPRIIHVPQPGEDVRASQASLRNDAPEDFDDDDADVMPPQRSHRAVKPQSKPQTEARPQAQRNAPTRTVVKASTHKEASAHKESARRRPFSVSLPEPPPPPPEPTGPKRALLSAPPPALSDGPTPLRPTPRFGQPLPEPSAAPPPAVASAPPSQALSPQAIAPQPAVPAPEVDDDADLPPPGDPALAPPEPKQ